MGSEMRDLLDAIEAERERADHWEHEADILKFERDEERERSHRLERDAAFWEERYYRSAGVAAQMTAELDLANWRRTALAKLLAWAMETGRILDREDHAAEVHGDGTDCPVCDHMQTEQAYEWLEESYAERDAERERAAHWEQEAEILDAELDLAERRRAALEKLLAWERQCADDEDLIAMGWIEQLTAEREAWREYAQTCEAALRAVVDEVQS